MSRAVRRGASRVRSTISDDPCSATRSCVWRASQRLTDLGKQTSPWDLCVGITDAGEPCGKKATEVFGGNDKDHPGQPFCETHALWIARKVVTLTTDPRWFALLIHTPERIAEWAAFRERERQEEEERVRDTQRVYFARCGGTVKIGYTTNLDKRIRSLETMAGVRFDEIVSGPGNRALEKKYHRRFADHRQIGEWFNMTSEIRGEMDRMEVLAYSSDI